MRKIFTFLFASCLFSATVPVRAQIVLPDSPEGVEAEIKAQQIAMIGKYGRLELGSEMLHIVEVDFVPNVVSAQGFLVVSMDRQHQVFRTFFDGNDLNRRGIDKDKFALALQNPKTIVNCGNRNPIYLHDMLDLALCQKDFVIRSIIPVQK